VLHPERALNTVGEQTQLECDPLEPVGKNEILQQRAVNVDFDAMTVRANSFISPGTRPRDKMTNERGAQVLAGALAMGAQMKVQEVEYRQAIRHRGIPVDDAGEPIILNEQVSCPKVSVPESTRKVG